MYGILFVGHSVLAPGSHNFLSKPLKKTLVFLEYSGWVLELLGFWKAQVLKTVVYIMYMHCCHSDERKSMDSHRDVEETDVAMDRCLQNKVGIQFFNFLHYFHVS